MSSRQNGHLDSPAVATAGPKSAKNGGNLPRLALSRSESAAALGCSLGFFEEYVLPELRVARRGRRVFVAVTELERWLDRSSALTLEGQ